ncbi:2-oxo-4-hydroxy-4-carboxy-5-ureidoimidazoline decarboxylase [Nocardia mangyaensis]|uniref:2-oxo-4-hydroxy-4-carboxy-5-ureidoimidazoline decarboxylase n=1 Tax=Nocardia mangyaensis TaxID=2213200 RepID=UPI002675BFF7|nr:2-oxo-4-hydroxy-4-carboxy-5-ureidoimidazoline decarboxylase [Nocardia mangyaensis]MDO3648813.1 2-oxo-4-hydroxy-4-carboxy-5-ureidoimidazoline decarboxylase [Nocardia mangyaensis]
MQSEAIGLAGFNDLPVVAAESALLACCSAPRWARAVVAARPYDTADSLFAAADAALAALDDTDIDEALAGHPRIGDRPTSAASAREQSGVSGAQVRSALAEGNRAYEAKFGHIYLVCAAGRGGEELLALLRARLDNDAPTERQVMRTELAKINRLRLARLVDPS